MIFYELLSPHSNSRLVYHYTRASTAIEHILRRNELRLSSLSDMNDPMEYNKFDFSVTGGPTDSERQTDSLCDRVSGLRERIQRIKICCFCQDDPVDLRECQYQSIFNKGYCRPRMWTQYGDSHKGVCIVLDRYELQSQISTATIPDPWMQPVAYTNQLDSLRDATSLDARILLNSTTKEILRSNIDSYLFTKHKDYEDEREFRIAVDTEEEVVLDCGTAIKAVVLGDRFPVVYRVNINQVAPHLGIEVLELRWFNGNPDLQPAATQRSSST